MCVDLSAREPALHSLNWGTPSRDTASKWSQAWRIRPPSGEVAAGQLTSRTSSSANYAWAGLFNVDRGYTPNGLNQIASTTTPSTLTYDPRGQPDLGRGDPLRL